MSRKTSLKKRDVLNIWIDGYEANVPQRLGSSQIGFELLKNLEKIDKKNRYTILLPGNPLSDLPHERAGWRYKILRFNKLWTRIALPIALFRAQQKPDVMFSPTHYIPRFNKVKKVATIFDLAYLYFPNVYLKKDLYKLKNWTKFSAEHSQHIITISKYTKADIVKNYQVAKANITVCYPGFNSDVFKPVKRNLIEGVIEKYQINPDYLIYIGTIQPKKNLPKLIEAFAKLIKTADDQKVKNLKLVLVGKTSGLGKQGWMYEETLHAPEKFGVSDKVIFTGFVPTEDLPALICGAKAYLLPSLYEGFGIPVLDSMACGTPVIVSNVSSLPEIVGDAGILVDPNSVDQIAQAMATIVTDKKFHLRKSQEGLVQAKKYSWTKMAKEVLKVLEEVGYS